MSLLKGSNSIAIPIGLLLPVRKRKDLWQLQPKSHRDVSLTVQDTVMLDRSNGHYLAKLHHTFLPSAPWTRSDGPPPYWSDTLAITPAPHIRFQKTTSAPWPPPPERYRNQTRPRPPCSYPVHLHSTCWTPWSPRWSPPPHHRTNGINQVTASIKIALDAVGRLCNPRISILCQPQ